MQTTSLTRPSSLLVHVAERAVSRGGTVVLHDIEIHLHHGERIALLGPSGAGKSTLLQLVYHRLADSGERVALVPQDLGLADNLSAWHNIYMGRLSHYRALYNLLNLIRPLASRRREIDALAAQLGLGALLGKPTSALSGGQRQRVAIARALYSNSPLVLADEPVANLDPPTARGALELLLARCPTAVIALHDVDQAMACCDRIVALKNGHVLFDAPAADVAPAMLDHLYGDDERR